MKALLVPDLSFFSFAYTLFVSAFDVSPNCANASDTAVSVPFTSLPFSISGSLCPSNDSDTFSFYLARTSRLRFDVDEAVQVAVTDGQNEQVIVLNGVANAPTTVLFLRGNHQLTVSSVRLLLRHRYLVQTFDARC